jgi:hypothetical protein
LNEREDENSSARSSFIYSGESELFEVMEQPSRYSFSLGRQLRERFEQPANGSSLTALNIQYTHKIR